MRFVRKGPAPVVEDEAPLVTMLGGMVAVENYALVCAGLFALQTAIVFAGNAKLLGGLTNAEVSRKYQTLVTPAGWAFAIWAVIYLSEACGVAHMLLSPRSSVVAAGAADFAHAMIFQAAWAIMFSRELILPSAFMLTGIAHSLTKCMRVLAVSGALGLDRLLVLLPVALHAGWVTAAALVNWNLVIVANRRPLEEQISAAFLSIHGAIAAAVAAFVMSLDNLGQVFSPGPFLVAISWALVAISQEVDSIVDLRIPYPLRRSLSLTSGVGGYLILALSLARLIGMQGAYPLQTG